VSDADVFRQYAEEAMHGSSKATSENEKRTLADLACTWAQAALMVTGLWDQASFRLRTTLVKPHRTPVLDPAGCFGLRIFRWVGKWEASH
jgi:hypothetical protein